MTTQLNYRGLAFEFSTYSSVESGELATFRGRQTPAYKPLKPPVALPANLLFLGRRLCPMNEVDGSTLSRTKLATA